MNIIPVKLEEMEKSILELGFAGENMCTGFSFICDSVFSEYPDAVPSMAVTPPKGSKYPVVVTRDGNNVLWNVTDSDTAYMGNGEVQLIFTQNNVVKRSYTCRTRILKSIIAEGTPPDPVQSWIDSANEMLAEIPETIDTAIDTAIAAAKASGEFKGDPGFSPVVTTAPISGGNSVTITDEQGDHTFNVLNGTNGVSPDLSVTDITNGHRVTITDASGTNTFDVMNGENGVQIDDTTPSATKTYSSEKVDNELSLISNAIHGLDSFEYKFSGTDLLIAFGYSDTNDYVIVMNEGRANSLFDFSKLCTKPKNISLESLETADLTTVWTSGTDFHSPFKFLATSNADGYHSEATSPGFTGGNHTLDGLGDNFKTASSVYVKYYADGKPVTSGCGKANNFEIKWANDVQAYNTVKQGGGGRACLREHHNMVFDGIQFSEKITLEPLEEISMKLWYGLQCASIGATYDSIAFVDATNRGVFAYNDQNVKSGNAVTSGLNCWGNGHRIEMSVDASVDLGKRTYYSGDSGAFCTTTKGYFYIIGQTITMAKGALYYLYGAYRFMQEIVVGVPCTGITLDHDTLSFESAEETKTLTATVTPVDTTDSVIWSSSDENVATVNNGVVTIHGIGTATITATCGNQTATATINQTSLKAQYSMKVVNDKYPNNRTLGNDSVLSISSLEGQKAIGQTYHEANTDLHVYSGQTNDIECIRVPYGATAVKVKTSDDVAVSLSYVCIGDTTSIITYNDVDYAEYVSKTANVNTNNGLTVEYGQCVIIRIKDEQYPTLQYVYFT